MDAATLAAAMGKRLTAAQYAELTEPFNAALLRAQCTTVNRAAMFCAQVGHESAGLFYREEIASGAAYEGRKDLGNTQPGDGRRFKGRGPIQLTGRHNYGAFSRWCFGAGLVPTADHFVRNPTLVAEPRWGLLAASWYWTVARPALNGYADAGDIHAATRAINGGLNGLADRTTRWTRCRALGTRLLPTPIEEDDVDARQDAMLTGIFHQMSGSPQPGKWPGWPSFAGGPNATLLDFLRRTNADVVALRTEVAKLTEAVAKLTARGPDA